MQRWLGLLLSAVSVVSCSAPALSWEEALPAQAGAWKRSQISSLPVAEAPEMVRQLGFKRAAAVTYTGSATVPVRVFEMNVSTSAFELIQ